MDLITEGSLEDPYFRDRIYAERKPGLCTLTLPSCCGMRSMPLNVRRRFTQSKSFPQVGDRRRRECGGRPETGGGVMREARLGDVVASMKNGLYKPASEYADRRRAASLRTPGPSAFKAFHRRAALVAGADGEHIAPTSAGR